MTLTVALLHMGPRPGDVERNKSAIDKATRRASMVGARVIVTLELAVSGYGFRDVIGTQ